MTTNCRAAAFALTALVGAVGVMACTNGDVELFRLRSACATLATSLYERELRDRSRQTFPAKVWDLRSRYDSRSSRCYASFRIADDLRGQHVIYDAQSNGLVAGGDVPLAGDGPGSGTVFLKGSEQKFQTFADFESWILRFMDSQ